MASDPTGPPDAPVLLLVHGAFHGAWCFERLTPELEARGVDVATVDLPLTTLADDAAAVGRAIDGIDPGREVVLLGHSYGGAVITVAGNDPRVRSLVFLTALAPVSGGGVADAEGGVSAEFIDALEFGDDGLMAVDPTRAAALFFPDADPDDAEAWASRLRRGNTGIGETIEHAAWLDRPTAYVVCVDDPIIGADDQRALAERAGAVVSELPGDHSPFLARPADLADALVAALSKS